MVTRCCSYAVTQLNTLVTSLMVREIQVFGKQHLQDVIGER